MDTLHTEVTLEEAKADLESLVERASQGERITIVCGNRAKVDLTCNAKASPSKRSNAEIARLFERMANNRKGVTLGASDWKDLRDYGRR